jgi:hypothetical protein
MQKKASNIINANIIKNLQVVTVSNKDDSNGGKNEVLEELRGRRRNLRNLSR